MINFCLKICIYKIKSLPLQRKNKGAIAQLVEQRTENPCVPGSIPGGTTEKTPKSLIISSLGVFLLFLDLILATI